MTKEDFRQFLLGSRSVEIKITGRHKAKPRIVIYNRILEAMGEKSKDSKNKNPSSTFNKTLAACLTNEELKKKEKAELMPMEIRKWETKGFPGNFSLYWRPEKRNDNDKRKDPFTDYKEEPAKKESPDEALDRKEIELQRIREEMELRAKVEDEIEEKREEKRREKEEKRRLEIKEKEEQKRQEMKEKDDIKLLIDRWYHQLPRVYHGQKIYLYIAEIHIYHDYVPSDRMECIVDSTDDDEKYLYHYPDAFVSYFGQTLEIEEDWPYKKYARAHLPEITKLFEDMKKGAQEHFRKKMEFTVEEGIRNRREEYREVYLNLPKGGCTDPEVIRQVETIREMIETIQQDKYY